MAFPIVLLASSDGKSEKRMEERKVQSEEIRQLSTLRSLGHKLWVSLGYKMRCHLKTNYIKTEEPFSIKRRPCLVRAR